MAKLVAATDLKSVDASLSGSSPAARTTYFFLADAAFSITASAVIYA